VKGPWSVILERPGEAPQLVSTHVQHSRAASVVFAVAEQHKHLKGTRVYLQTPDSADSLQRHSGGVIRDQPDLPRVGEDVTILVPTARRVRP